MSVPRYDSLDGFARADEALISARALLKRIDTKFLISAEQVERLLTSLVPHFAVVEAAGKRVATYDSHYFDTQKHHFLREHFRGVRPRHKVRIRHYFDRELTFLEVKRKRASGVVEKFRLQKPDYDLALDGEAASFVSKHVSLSPSSMRAVMLSRFSRVSLVGIDLEERLTIDFNLTFSAGAPPEVGVPQVVVELKQPRFVPRSRGFLALRALGARPSSFSKYCVGMALVHEVPHRHHLTRYAKDSYRYV